MKANKMIEKIKEENTVIAIIIRSEFNKDGIEFFTPDDFSQQLAYMRRPREYKIPPHVHNPVQREVQLTQEVLFIKSGKVRVDFYNNNKKYIESGILHQGDIILLADGGHGFKMIEESEIIEVKQGPYSGDHDKVRFDPVNRSEVEIKD